MISEMKNKNRSEMQHGLKSLRSVCRIDMSTEVLKTIFYRAH